MNGLYSLQARGAGASAPLLTGGSRLNTVLDKPALASLTGRLYVRRHLAPGTV
ncbi:hypothetical protein SMD44_p10003 (plasmid) [Streptomyces alboflavus]|uniref:Uncharacterized protein n=1 Tax=Streptomyces alboflavus TaxID=67267 RepID=A0A291W4M5_9ACTN|nr:hypothetical protein SMD44_p10003 [Streptomyces alboflavus]